MAMETTQYFSRILKDLGLDNIEQVFKKILPKLQANEKELRILVTGRSGQGKSALINGLIGAKVAKEGARAEHTTKEVKAIKTSIAGVPISIFDSPGLQDCTDNEELYIQTMTDQCKELSLVLYCTKMTNTRLTDADKNAMLALTRSFGENFWNYAVFVLTFANMEDVDRKDERDEDDYNDMTKELPKAIRQQRFEGRVRLWQHGLHDFLIKEVKVTPNITFSIPVVPAGDHRVMRNNRNPLRLPGRENWFNSFWQVCCLRIKETSLFLEINDKRMIVCSDDLLAVKKELESSTQTTSQAVTIDVSDSPALTSNDTKDCSSNAQENKAKQLSVERINSTEDVVLGSQTIEVGRELVKNISEKFVKEGLVDDLKDIDNMNNTFGEDLRIPKKDAIPRRCDVLRILTSIAHQWCAIGMFLEVPNHTLESLQQSNKSSIVCLGTTIQSWLDSTPTPSWNTVLNVVEDDLGNKRLGMDIQHFLSSYM